MPSGSVGEERNPITVVLQSERHTVRDLEMKIEVIPKTTTVRLIVTNLTPEKKYLRTPLGLCQQYRITLTDEKGQPLEMTAKGIEDLTVPANGSVRVAELETGQPRVALVRLEPLFNLPQRGSFAVRSAASSILAIY